MKIAVIDDERPARKELIFLLESILEDAEFLEADSAESAIELVKNEKIQAFFLDINLGEVKGTTLASIIREKQPDAGIVFVTAYENYAVEAFELDAVDYVMKPFDMKRLQKAVEKLKNQGFLEMKPAQKETTLKPHAGKIAVNGGDRIHLIDLKEIIVVEANQRSCRICTKNHVYEENIQEDTVRLLYHVKIEQKVEREQVAKVTGTNKDESAASAPKKRAAAKVYPNDPCPCGSGKKYKQCCGRMA